MELKQLFLEALSNGDMGAIDDLGVVVTLEEFERKFPDTRNMNSAGFLPSSTLDTRDQPVCQDKFLYVVRKDVYRVHPDALDNYTCN